MRIQFVQIYKEQLFDLLNPVQGANLRIRYDPRTDAPYVENITQNVVHNTQEVLKLTKIAISNRVTDRTKMNAVSSRSHLVMSILVEQRKANGTKINSKLNFGDLAGSESIRKTGVKLGSKQFNELKSINLSLTQLTTVINDIVNGRRPAFRASKLTYLLQDSLGGNTKTTIVVCASPHIYNRDETIRTLTFAQSAKSIKNKAKINREYTSGQLKKIIQNLEADNERLKKHVAKLETEIKLGLSKGDISNNPEYKKLRDDIREMESEMETFKKKEMITINELKDQLRLKGLDLDDTLLQVDKLQSEKRQEDVAKESMNMRINELEKKLDKAKNQLNKMSATEEQMKMTIENLEDQLTEKNQFIQLQKGLFADLHSKMELKDEELSYQTSKNQDMMGQILTLKKKLADEQQARIEAEKQLASEQQARIEAEKQLASEQQARVKAEKQVSAMSFELDEKQHVEKEKDALQLANTQLEKRVGIASDLQKATELAKRLALKNTQLAQSLKKAKDDNTQLKEKLGEAGTELQKRTKDLQNADVKLKNAFGDLDRARSEAKEAEERLTPEQVLAKYNMNEEVLQGIEGDLNSVLQAWKNRKKRRKQKIRPPNPNSTISLQVRHVIAYFNIAMGQLKEYEKGKTEREVKLENIQMKTQKIRDLKKNAKKMQQTIASLRKEKDELSEQIEKYKNSREYLSRAGNEIESDDRMLMSYLDGATEAALRGDDPDLEKQMLFSSVSSEEEDEEADKSMQRELEQERQSILAGGWRNRLKVGDKVDSLDSNALWFTASIIDQKADEQGDKMLVQYDGFDHKYDEWILRFDPKLAQPGTKAKGGKESGGQESYALKVLGKRSGSNFVKAGYMLKSSKKDGNFKARYFVLFEDGILRFYSNEQTLRILGAINMCHAKDIRMEEADYLLKVFQFTLQGVGGKWTLRCTSHEEMNIWIYALKNVKLQISDARSRTWFEEQKSSESASNIALVDESKECGTEL